MKQVQRPLLLWLLAITLLLAMLHLVGTPQIMVDRIRFDQFLGALESGRVTAIEIDEEEYRGTLNDGTQFVTVGPIQSEQVLSQIKGSKVKFSYRRTRETPWQQFLLSWLPTLLFLGFFLFSMRQLQMGGGKAMSFGRSKARLLMDQQKKVTFADVAGIEEAQEELEEIIEFLKEPKKFTRLGGHIPKGVLLMGAPGTGKTLLARAIAGEAGVPFFSMSGSDFVEMFVGVGASRVRDLFEQGKKHAPCIIFIDEIDAVGRSRGAGLGGGHDEREQTLNQLLVEMDGFESKEGVIIIAATNRPDVLDPALMRPGRFDRRIIVPRPDVKGREGILKVHARKLKVVPELDLSRVARGTPGFSGADLESVVNEAALLAARQNKQAVAQEDFELAKDKVMMGSERRSLIITPDEKRKTAFHEAGHALVAKLIPGTDPVHKVSIIPRGHALGVTQQLPTDDRYTQDRKYCEGAVAVLMGGRAAEELVFDQPTTGAGNDIERATHLARKMVCEWGMSDKMGPLAFGKKDELIFLGREISQPAEYSEMTAREIDEEIRRIVMENFARAKQVLQANRDTLTAIAEALLEREVIDGSEIDRLLRGETLNPQTPAASTSPPTPTTATPTVSEGRDPPVRAPIPAPSRA
ncbi:MAG: ATP-dependent zinc metalloprotease FtsH [Deltaproteobacteria bacterium]|nr:ATP-dependent zinc metalloprotease FtsH [Deltaproteobacteria bacterium]